MRIGIITRQWLLKTFIIISLLMAAIAATLSGALHMFYYNNVRSTLSAGYNSIVTRYFSTIAGTSDEEFNRVARAYIETYALRDIVDVWVIDRHGAVVATSDGFRVPDDAEMPDYTQAVASEKRTATWTGRIDGGEKIMATTYLLGAVRGETASALRFSTSLEKVDAQFRSDVLLLAAVSLIAVLLTLVPGTLYIEKLVRAVRKTTDAASRIAEGDYSTRVNYDEHDEIGALCTAVHDMADEISAADKMKNEFISTVSHELRTPLTAIRGWGETLREVGADDPALTKRGIDVILKETSRLGGMVEELLDFSRIQNDRLSLRIAQMDVVRELDEAVLTFRERAARESKQLLYAPAAVEAPMIGDADRITQVFVNVIDNALKYTDAGGTIRIGTSVSGRMLEIRISDTGRGISERDLPHVTEKFYKADQAVRGSGIGLAVANEIVRLHKGTLRLESVRGAGTTVIITLPLLGEERSLENGQE
jgi:signal transduction histidine kinase